MSPISNLMYVTFKWALRDRVLHAMFGVALLLLLLVPALSLFSMRQVQELSITLSLSSISLALLFLSILFSASSIWRDIEKRYTTSVLGLPISRAAFVLGKFAGITSLLGASALLLGAASWLVINLAATLHPSDLPVLWTNVWTAILFDLLKYLVLAACGMLFSALSTSFFLPFFGTVSVYLAGCASQEVYDFVTSPSGRQVSPLFKMAAKSVYYLLPNFAAFNLKVQAVYGLPLAPVGLAYTFAYSVIYTFLMLAFTVWIFSRRELP